RRLRPPSFVAPPWKRRSRALRSRTRRRFWAIPSGWRSSFLTRCQAALPVRRSRRRSVTAFRARTAPTGKGSRRFQCRSYNTALRWIRQRSPRCWTLEPAAAVRAARSQSIDGRLYAEDVGAQTARYVVIGRGVVMIAEGGVTMDQARAAVETIGLQRLEAMFGR